MKKIEPLAQRRKTRTVRVGDVPLGSEHPVAVQSMTNTDTRDAGGTLAQIAGLREAGCEIVRVAVPDNKALAPLGRIVREAGIPIVADIHFSHRLALGALDAGVAKLRLNPGNIGDPDRVREVARAAGSAGVPVRIGVNAGSLEKKLMEKHGGPTAGALCESALAHCRLMEDAGFGDIVVSIKASDVPTTVRANRLFAGERDYPIHIGVTEAGTLSRGTVLNSLGCGILLAEGIGDTVRVSLTADPVEELTVARHMLNALGLRRDGVRIISCPTCGRAEMDIIAMAGEVERRLRHVSAPLVVAVMGCIVNGPGEAAEADYGIAGGRGRGMVFSKGQKVDMVAEAELIPRLLELIEEELREME